MVDPLMKLANDVMHLASAAHRRGVPADEIAFVSLQAVISLTLRDTPPHEVGKFLSEIGHQVSEGRFPAGLSPKH
jgi:hypothetical protein